MRKRKKSVKLSKNKFQQLIGFERQLQQLDNTFGGCTTVDNYVFKLNEKEVFEVSDDTCDWGGFQKIKR